MKPLITRTDLDAELAKLECECCDESVDVLVFEPRCHRDAGLAADYGDGELTFALLRELGTAPRPRTDAGS
jgi:hypothetical protein